MIHIHPFPARMAPEIALRGLENLPTEALVLDPMSGSGMVIGTASRLGLNSIGYDLDPLACLVSRTNGTPVNPDKARQFCDSLIEVCTKLQPHDISLPWVDLDADCIRYINFWFAKKQQIQLRALSYALVAHPFTRDKVYLDLLKVALSRLIITKEPKASLARDTAHSRPHKTIQKNSFDLFEALPNSVEHVLSALKPHSILKKARTYQGDARKMGRIGSCSVDCIVTSPPYLNAIDYMRGHRLSLIWLGYSISKLRRIRTRSVGAETMDDRKDCAELIPFFSSLHESIDRRKKFMLQRYYKDLIALTKEACRVLKFQSTATYVIGDSKIKNRDIKNSELLILAASQSGLRVIDRYERDIPENRRYMPVKQSQGSTLSNRMRSEHVIVFEKPRG